jgi:hypothetical protein
MPRRPQRHILCRWCFDTDQPPHYKAYTTIHRHWQAYYRRNLNAPQNGDEPVGEVINDDGNDNDIEANRGGDEPDAESDEPDDEDIDQRLDLILQNNEIEQYLDEPCKYFSIQQPSFFY